MKILVCTDGSENSNRVVEEAAKLAEAMKEVAVITLLHTYKRKYAKSSWYLSDGESAVTETEMRKHLENLDEKESKERKKVLETAAEVFKRKNIEVSTMLKEGHPAKTICEAATKGNFDLVVIGSRGRGDGWGIMLGSVSNAVVQNCEKKVLVVK